MYCGCVEKLGKRSRVAWTSVSFLPYCACSRLRALSSGSSVASPPSSPAMPKYKLADYRYGREEMLALYVKENKVGWQGGSGAPSRIWLCK
jgi:hypothetical protein